jgi:DNA polymerase-1
VDNIYAHLDEVNPNIRQKLEVNKDNAKLFHRLATIVRDVPIKIDFPQMEKWKIDSPDVLKLFEDYGFKTLTDRIKKAGREIDGEKQGSLF